MKNSYRNLYVYQYRKIVFSFIHRRTKIAQGKLYLDGTVILNWTKAHGKTAVHYESVNQIWRSLPVGLGTCSVEIKELNTV